MRQACYLREAEQRLVGIPKLLATDKPLKTQIPFAARRPARRPKNVASPTDMPLA